MGKQLKALECISNDQTLPGGIVDWASGLYDKLIDRNASVRVIDLIALEYYMHNDSYQLIERAIIS